MNMLNADEDLPIEAGMVSGAINNAQKKVEAHHFDIRKHVLQYDDVINTQREVIYRERRLILEGADIHENIVRMFNERLDELIRSYIGANDPIEIWFITDDEQPISRMTQLFEALKADFTESIVTNISKPYDSTDFIARYQSYEGFTTKLKESLDKLLTDKEAEVTPGMFREAERQIMLHIIDSKWIEHIHGMDSLKDGIHLQSYGQKDPLIEYKKEAFAMFDELLLAVRKDTVILLAHAQIVKETVKS
jgi:preprotein translocase subunit SecA